MKQIKDHFLAGDETKGNPYKSTDLAEGFQAGLDHETFNANMPQVVPGAYATLIGSYSVEAKHMMEFVPELREGETAADLGCGTGIAAIELALAKPYGKIIGIDPVAGMLEIARDKFGQPTRYDIRDAADPRIHLYLNAMREQGTPHGGRVSFQVGSAKI